MKPNKVIDTLKKHILADGDFVIDIEKSQDSWIVNALTGKTYLDCFSQFASQPLGWNHPKMLAQKDRLTSAALHKIANSDMYCSDYGEFVAEFAKYTTDFKYHFYVSGGSLAAENALKVAFDWKCRKLGRLGSQVLSQDKLANNLDVVYLKNAFHGRSGYTLSLTNNPKNNKKTKLFPKFDKWRCVTNPKLLFPVDEVKAKNITNVALAEVNAAITARTAAIIIEPIQGEGGDCHFHKSFFEGLRKLADEKDVMLILDEVQTGVGLTGKFWCYEHYGIVPDIVCFGKKMQVCGICCTDRVDEVDDHAFVNPSRINSTWGGNIVDMVRATMYLKIIKEDNLVENAAEVGEYFLEELKGLDLDNVRGKGLMIAFDLDNTSHRDTVFKKLKEDMMVLVCGEKSIRFRPHLTFTKENVNEAISTVKRCV